MAKYLVIVESPAKVKTIKKFLGKNYEVAASNGHVRDLPKSQLGIDVEHDYEPKYITIRGKGDILANLRKEVKKAEEENNSDFEFTELEDFFKATFSQTILVDTKSIGKKDEEKGTIALEAYVVDYVGSPKIDGEKVAIKKNITYPMTFEVAINEKPDVTAKMLQRFFKPKKKMPNIQQDEAD